MKKKLLFILILLGILIIGYNAVWLINLQKYIKLEHKVGYSEHYGTYATVTSADKRGASLKSLDLSRVSRIFVKEVFTV